MFLDFTTFSGGQLPELIVVFGGRVIQTRAPRTRRRDTHHATSQDEELRENANKMKKISSHQLTEHELSLPWSRPRRTTWSKKVRQKILRIS